MKELKMFYERIAIAMVSNKSFRSVLTSKVINAECYKGLKLNIAYIQQIAISAIFSTDFTKKEKTKHFFTALKGELYNYPLCVPLFSPEITIFTTYQHVLVRIRTRRDRRIELSFFRHSQWFKINHIGTIGRNPSYGNIQIFTKS